LIDDPESHLSLPRVNDHIAPCADDRMFAILIRRRNQSDMVYEVNVEKILGFFFREVALCAEKTTV
jgi:hypothetical protein